MSFVNNDGESFAGSFIKMIVNYRELLQCGDDDAFSVIDSIAKVPTALLFINGNDGAKRMIKAGYGCLQLLIQYPAVGDNDHAGEHRFIVGIMQAGHAIGRPCDGVGLSAACAVLDQVIVSGTIVAYMSDQFAYHIQLMIAGEDDLHLRFHPLVAVRAFCLFFFFLYVDEFLDNVQQLILLPNFFPKIAGHIVPIIGLRVTCSAIIACAVAALIEGQKHRLVTVDICCHGGIIQIHRKVRQDALILAKTWFLRIAGIHPLPLGIIDALPGQLILELNCHHRDAVDSQHHVHSVGGGFRIVPLPDALAHILLIVGDRKIIQGGFRCKVAYSELNATVLEPMTKNIYQTHLLHCTVEGLIKLSHRIDGAHAFKAPPCHGLTGFYKICQGDDVQCHAAIVVIAVTGIICLLPAAFGGDEVFLDLTLKESLIFLHALHHLSFACDCLVYQRTFIGFDV